MERRIAISAVVLLVALCRVGGGTMSSFEAKASPEWTLPREGASDLEIRTPNGAIRVGAADGEQIRVLAAKQVRAGSEAAARSFLERMTIERRREGGRWVVAATWPTPLPHDIQSPRVAFEISAPPGMRLEAQSGNGEIETIGMREARLRTGSGGIRAGDLAGRLEAHTGNGAIRVDRCAGAVQVDSGSGGIAIRQAQRSVKATTGNGTIDVELARGDGPVQVELKGVGNIDLRLPENASARLEADADSGRFDLELPPGIPSRRERTHLEAVLGDGQGSIRLRASNGAIRVRLATRP